MERPICLQEEPGVGRRRRLESRNEPQRPRIDNTRTDDEPPSRRNQKHDPFPRRTHSSPIRFFRRPLALAIFCSLSSLSLYLFQSLTKSSLRAVDDAPQADFPSLVHIEVQGFDELLAGVGERWTIALEVKKVEMATRDLAIMVQHSDLIEKESLSDSLVRFAASAGAAGRSLTTFDSKVKGALDTIMATNDYVLSAMEKTENTKSLTWLPSALVSMHQEASGRKTLGLMFEEAMEAMVLILERLLLDAEARQLHLTQLEDELETIYNAVSSSDSMVESKAEMEAIPAALWALLSKDKAEIRNSEEQFALLENLGEYKRQASVHVLTSLKALQALSSNLDELRERLVAPALVNAATSVREQTKSIERGLVYLKERRMYATNARERAAAQFVYRR